MNIRLILGYVLLGVCVLALAAACFLAVNNIGGEWTMQVFWRPVTLTPAVWLLLAAVSGVVLLVLLARVLPVAIGMIGKGREARREHLLKQVLHDAQQAPAAGSPKPGSESEKR